VECCAAMIANEILTHAMTCMSTENEEVLKLLLVKALTPSWAHELANSKGKAWHLSFILYLSLF
jgi:hypothetical protein